MHFLLQPCQILLAALCGVVNQRQQQVIEFQNAQIEALWSDNFSTVGECPVVIDTAGTKNDFFQTEVASTSADSIRVQLAVSETRAAMPPEMPLIASAIVDSTRQAVRSIKAVEGLGVDAIQITPVHYLFRPDDEMMIEHFRVIHEETGMPLIIYNVVHWCYLSPELTVRLMNEVPGVMGIKQSAGDLKLFADLMINAPKDRRIYSAVDALMYPSFCLGTPGVIAATPSGIPRATALLRDAVAKGDHANALRLHEAILRFWNSTDHFNLPACIRYAQSLQGVDAGLPRMPMRSATETQKAKIKPALEAVLKLSDELS